MKHHIWSAAAAITTAGALAIAGSPGLMPAHATVRPAPLAASAATASRGNAVRPQNSFTATYQNEHTGWCLDDSFSSGLRAIGCENPPLDYQIWIVTINSDNTITFKNEHTGRCIDDSFSSHLRSYTCNGLDYQKWIDNFNPDASETFQNVHTHYCIDDSFSSLLRDYTCNFNGDYQRWRAGPG
jgi:hypothetical protein